LRRGPAALGKTLDLVDGLVRLRCKGVDSNGSAGRDTASENHAVPQAAIKFAVERSGIIDAGSGVRALSGKLANTLSSVGEEWIAFEVEDERTGDSTRASGAPRRTPAAVAVRLIEIEFAGDAVAQAEIPVDVDGHGDGAKLARNTRRLADRAVKSSIGVQDHDEVLRFLKHIDAAVVAERQACRLDELWAGSAGSCMSGGPAAVRIEHVDEAIGVV
jgi:hypothetical protein